MPFLITHLTSHVGICCYFFTQAIKNGSLRKLEDSIKTMTSVADSGMNYLDVCYLQSAIVTHMQEPVLYYMTLLAHAAVNKQKGMVKYLLEKGASKIHNSHQNFISLSPFSWKMTFSVLIIHLKSHLYCSKSC